MTMQNEKYQADIIIIGGGLAGIAAASDLLEIGKKVLILERGQPIDFGGLAKESFGGIMMVGTPQQKKSAIKDTPELALADWLRYAEFDENDILPRKWAHTYVHTSKEVIYDWLTQRAVKFMPVVNWPERGMQQRGNSVPRWHITWGTGHALMENVVGYLNAQAKRGNLRIHFGHCVNAFTQTNGSVVGCSGVLEEGGTPFAAKAEIVIVAAGGICGGNLKKVREHWFSDWGEPPKVLLNGAHRFADGLLHDRVQSLGGKITHLDKQWHYAAGIHHPTRENHGLSLVPPRSALWLNANGKRIGPPPLQGYTDTRYLVEQICKQPGKFSWQVLNWKIAIKELAVSGSEYMEAFRYKKKLRMILDILLGNKRLVKRLMNESQDFVVADSVAGLVSKMNDLETEHKVDIAQIQAEIQRYDDEIARGPEVFEDEQLKRLVEFRRYRGDRLRLCNFQKINDEKAMPLIAIREHILSRKSLGGIQTDLQCRVLDKQGEPIPGLLAIGEAAGFGGGGIHGLRSLEGTFLGGCILTGRMAARVIDRGL